MVCARADPANFADGAVRLMAAILDGQRTNQIDGILKRGDYSAILAKLAQAIPQPQRLSVFYEDMFAPGGLTPLCDFLGIRPVEPVPETRVHAGLPLTLPDALQIRAKMFLQGQYQAVQDRMGTVPAIWLANHI